MPKNIAVFIDGTDDTFTSGAKNNSNVGILYEASINDERQFKFYSDGPGIGGHLVASTVGTGVNTRVQRGYNFCVENYENGDQIFIFGFSRGAFAARSVAGMIRAVGVLRKDAQATKDDAFAVYEKAKDDPAAAAAFKAANSIDVKIHFIGVWETVGSIDVPIGLTLDAIPLDPFHDVSLGPDIENAFHAVSIDEERWDFQPTYFNAYLAQPGQTVEEVFFPGVHSDVGGGYDDDASLSKVPLAWLATHAQEHGLLIADRSVLDVPAGAWAGMLHDSFSAIYDFRSRFFRPIDFNAKVSVAAKQRLDAAAGVCKPGPYNPPNFDKANTGYNWIT
ncbi:MAG TPA: DUF2235 domain-containing protein [Thermoanaerobaculia bacterium]|nr:DUF2235 domain-containing protein [Thermoanaerobaculia bacterium]